MFFANSVNINKKVNIDYKNKDIINSNKYLNNLIKNDQNNLNKDINYDKIIENINPTTTLINSDIKTQNFKSNKKTKYSKKLLAYAYRKNKLVQATIITKTKGFQKLLAKILIKIKLSIENLKINSNKLYIKKDYTYQIIMS